MDLISTQGFNGALETIRPDDFYEFLSALRFKKRTQEENIILLLFHRDEIEPQSVGGGATTQAHIRTVRFAGPFVKKGIACDPRAMRHSKCKASFALVSVGKMRAKPLGQAKGRYD